MRRAIFVAACLLLACGKKSVAPYYMPTTDDSKVDSGSVVAADGGSAADGGDGAPGSDAGATIADVPHGAVFAQLRRNDGMCTLLGVWKSTGAVDARFPCTQSNHVFRRSDGALFYQDSGKIFQLKAGTSVQQTTACDVAGRFDFDAANHLYYRCTGGTTGTLYRDDKQLAGSDVVAELEGVLDDGRVIFQAFEDFHVLDATGKEVSQKLLPDRFTALEDATTVLGNKAYVLYRDDTVDSAPRYVIFQYSDAGWQQVASFSAQEPPPSNFGNGLRIDPAGALFVSLDGKVRRYDAKGVTKIVWTDLPGFKVQQFDELVYRP